MKRACLALLLICIVFWVSACAFVPDPDGFDEEQPSVICNGEVYETVLPGWYPLGELSENKVENNKGKVALYSYERDEKYIFLSTKDNLLFEGVVYHRKADLYPDYANIDMVSGVLFTDESGAEIPLTEDLYREILKYFAAAENRENSLVTEKINPSESGFLRIYFKEYPAYYEDLMLVFSDGFVGLCFSETEKNNIYLGDYLNAMLLPEPLAGKVAAEIRGEE